MQKTLLLIPALAILTACTNEKPLSPEAPATQIKPVPPVQVAQAALDGNIQIINQALAGGFDVDLRDDQQRTVLMYAAFNGHADIVKKLLDAGADVNAQDQAGTTPLMFGASGPDTKTVQLLIDAKADINMIDRNEHFTALMWAAAEGQIANVKLLLKHGADRSLKDIDGDTAESFALQRGHTAIAELLTTVGKE